MPCCKGPSPVASTGTLWYRSSEYDAFFWIFVFFDSVPISVPPSLTLVLPSTCKAECGNVPVVSRFPGCGAVVVRFEIDVNVFFVTMFITIGMNAEVYIFEVFVGAVRQTDDCVRWYSGGHAFPDQSYGCCGPLGWDFSFGRLCYGFVDVALNRNFLSVVAAVCSPAS